jgi:AraC-like DNA-binding protein
MFYQESKPTLSLAGYIKCFWSIGHDAIDSSPPEPVLPDGCPEIVFNFAERFQRLHSNGEVETQAAAIVSGQIKSRILIRPTAAVDLFGVRFQPAGAFAFFRLPLSELTDRVDSLLDVAGPAVSSLDQMMRDAGSFTERISIFESAMLKSLSTVSQTDPIADAATRMIVDSSGRMPVKMLTGHFGITERKLERAFNRSVGISAKLFSRIVRFQNVVRQIEAAESSDLLDTALEFGYYDQSHLIRDFNEFAGTSPLSYFEQTHRISEFFTASA